MPRERSPEPPMSWQPEQSDRRWFRNLLVFSFIQLFFGIVGLVPGVGIPFLPQAQHEGQHHHHARTAVESLWYVTAVQGVMTLGVPLLALYVCAAFFGDPALSKPNKASRVANISFACFVFNLIFIFIATVAAGLFLLFGLKYGKEEFHEDKDIKRVMLFMVPVFWGFATVWNSFVAAACYRAYAYADRVSAQRGQLEVPEAAGGQGECTFGTASTSSWAQCEPEDVLTYQYVYLPLWHHGQGDSMLASSTCGHLISNLSVGMEMRGRHGLAPP